jgi:hypothetical protein
VHSHANADLFRQILDLAEAGHDEKHIRDRLAEPVEHQLTQVRVGWCDILTGCLALEDRLKQMSSVKLKPIVQSLDLQGVYGRRGQAEAPIATA